MELHPWYHCHHCQAQPIEGVRWQCQTCPEGPENDLCDTCYQQWRAGRVEHPVRTSPGFGLQGEHRFKAFSGQSADRFSSWSGVPDALDSPAPEVVDAFVVRPEFRAGLQAAFGGHAFAVRHAGHTVLLTALHVMDELIKKHGIDTTAANGAYTGRELPAVVTKVVLYDLFAANWMLAELGSLVGAGPEGDGEGPMMVLPTARTGEEEPYSDLDIAAFSAAGADFLQPRPLAETPPSVGEPVWLAASVPGRSERTLAATVVEQSERTLVFRYHDRHLSGPLYTSGAPLLDATGAVVGINVGGGRLGEARIGHANHVTSVRAHLDGTL